MNKNKNKSCDLYICLARCPFLIQSENSIEINTIFHIENNDILIHLKTFTPKFEPTEKLMIFYHCLKNMIVYSSKEFFYFYKNDCFKELV